MQRRTLVTLSAAQVAGGIGIAVGLALSSVLVFQLSGSVAISGWAGTATVLGAALLAIPTAAAAGHGGRRAGLSLAYGAALAGCLIAVLAITIRSWPLLLAGLVLFGGGSAGNLAARYSATDLAPTRLTARHLSFVVWAATIGSVLGPNLAEPAERLAARLGLTGQAGPFALSAATFGIALVVVALALRPDPLLLARRTAAGGKKPPVRGKGTLRQAWAVLRTVPDARRALVAIAVSHTAMVSVMSMTPVHLDHGGATVSVIGLVISVHIAGMYVLSPVVGWLADRLGRVPVLLLGMGQLLTAVALAGSAGEHGVAQMSAGLFLLGTGWSCGLVAGSAMLTQAVPLERRTAAQGLSDLIMNACGAGGAAVAGLIVGTLSYGTLGGVVAVLVILCALWLLATGRTATA